MPKVNCFSIRGVECFFYSNDHSPPHFHAKRKGEWEYRVFFLEERMDVKWQKKKISPQHRKEILIKAETFRTQLYDEWESVVKQDEG